MSRLTSQANVNVRLESLRKEREAAKKDLLVLASKRDKDTRLLEDLQDEVDEVAAVVDAEDDKTFAAFCKRIKVANVREYEDVQLKAAQEENEAIEAFTTQIARVDHQ
jgi:structural maintenance of chromosome 1